MHINPRKFLGSKSSPCRKCRSINAYVNSLGGISCQTCYPPKKPEHCLLRIISESGVWTAEGEAFFSGSGDTSSDVANTPQAKPRPDQPADTSEKRESECSVSATQLDYPFSLYPYLPAGYRRRKSSEPFDALELTWAIEPGGILDQMAASAGTRQPAVSRPGETMLEIADRQARFRDGTFRQRRLAASNIGSIPAVTTVCLAFVRSEVVLVGGPGIPDRIERTNEEFPAGTACRLFPGQKVPDHDPAAAEIRSSITGHGKEGRCLVVVRMPAEVEAGGRLRLVKEDQIAVA